MSKEGAYIIYDFQIKQGLTDKLYYASNNPPDGFEIDYPNPKTGMTQGEIWRDIVQPKLKTASRIIAFIDLPNANVGFEIGYALGHGEGKKVALALHKPKIPDWLNQPPFKGFSCKTITTDSRLIEQVQSESWFEFSKTPQAGQEVLLLCPHESGESYIKTIQKDRSWRMLPKDGWSFHDLPEYFNEVGAVVWLILPHVEGEEARDGKENTALSVIAGYAEGCGIPLHVLVHNESRVVVDILAKSLNFSGLPDLSEPLAQVSKSIEESFRESQKSAVGRIREEFINRPSIGPMPDLDFKATVRQRFIGRERLLSDYEDALRGLIARFGGQDTVGGAKVQATWYHGFGGMGKSWFLRQAILNTEEKHPEVAIALIDWDNALWRSPLTQSPESPGDLFSPIAYRLAQIYGIEDLDPFWQVEERIREATPDRDKLLRSFTQSVDEVRRNEKPRDAIHTALVQSRLWHEDKNELEHSLKQLSYDADLREHVFRKWFNLAGEVVKDREATLDSNRIRISAMHECIRNVARKRPLVVMFDTCELLSGHLDRLLRRLFAAVCDGKTPILILIVSRLAPDVAEPPGSREGWRADIGDERWRSFAFDEDVRFTVYEIERALEKLKNPVPQVDGLAEALQRITLGVPLALRSLLDLHDGGDLILSELESMEQSPDSDSGPRRAEEIVVENVASRFLLHLRKRENLRKDYADVIALSLLTEANREVLSRLWNNRNVMGRLRDLSKRYSVLSVGDLHATVRSFLRRRWRMEDRDILVDETIEKLVGVIDQITLTGEPGDTAYFEALANRLNIQGWSREGDALRDFAPAIALALTFDDHVEVLIRLAAEINPDRKNVSKSKLIRSFANRFKPYYYLSDPWGSDELLGWLVEEESHAQWSEAEKASLSVLRGLKYSRDGQHEKALECLSKGVKVFSEGRKPRQALIGNALFNAGYELAKSAKTTELAEGAYRAAIEIGYSEATTWNNLAVLPHIRKRTKEALEYLLKAMDLDPNHPLFPRNVGDLYRELKQYDAAEEWLEKALKVDPKYAYAYNSLGLLFKDRKQYKEAEEQFRKAIDIDPSEPLYPRNIGDMYRELKQYDEAEKWCQESARIDSKYPYAYNSLGAILKERRQYKEAKTQYKKAIELDSNQPLFPRNIGDMLRESKQYDDAERWLRKALEIDPRYAVAYNDLGLLLRDRRQFTEAEVEFKKAIEFDPNEPLYPRNIGDMLRELKQYDDAETWFKKALAADSKYAAAYNDLGLLLKDLRQYEEAEVQFRKAMEFDPRQPLYPRNVGDMYRKLKQYDKAKKWLNDALAVDPKYAVAHNALALLFKDLRQYEEAETQFKKAMEFDPDQPLYPRNIGDMCRELKRHDEAEKWLQESVKIDSKYPYAYNSLGLLSKDLRRYEDAEIQFGKAIELDPHEPLYPRNIGDMCRELKRYEDAEKWLRKALEVDAKYAVAYNGLGLLFKDCKQHKEAEIQFKKAVELDPGEPIYPRNLGDMCRELKRFDDADKWLKKALEVDPEYATTYNDLGLLMWDLRKHDDAVVQFRKAAELDPTQPVYPRNIGDMYRELKRYEDAETWLKKALEVDPEYAAAYNGLGLLRWDLDQYREAETQFMKAIKLDPREPIYPRNVAAMFGELQRHAEAEKWYRESVNLDLENPTTLNSLAWFLYTQNRDLREAEELAKQAIAIDPAFRECVHTLADIQLKLKGLDYSQQMMLEWMKRADQEYLNAYRQDIVSTFLRILEQKDAGELLTLLDHVQDRPHWQPWIEAVKGLDKEKGNLDLSEEGRKLLEELTGGRHDSPSKDD